ncbi:hypothetical protein FACS18942_07650 [Planctomycetales bacterium]|nr:hypothetical protein FACS18942_07650 [Planctomycetales bacterium]GHT34948.1 hypothetical protein FACS189427_03230 [Planctomycetales bacterium]
MNKNFYQTLVPTFIMVGEDDEDTQMLHEMLERATCYVQSFQWSLPIKNTFFAGGIGNVIAVFLFEFEKKINDTDDALWIIEGDLPSAYLTVDEIHSATEAIKYYCDLMDEWINAVTNQLPLINVFPVQTQPTIDNAKLLFSRIRYIREQIVPWFEENYACPEKLSSDSNSEMSVEN